MIIFRSKGCLHDGETLACPQAWGGEGPGPLMEGQEPVLQLALSPPAFAIPPPASSFEFQ